MLHEGDSIAIQRLQSRGQIFWSKRKRLQRKEFNSHRIGLEDQRGRNFIVKTLCIVVPVRCKTGHTHGQIDNFS